ncbi:MAG: threonine--tRNA ligase [Eubacteriales bacterium]|nr:threonine--tRNA ligase [Eubacteriales bacterium]
MNNIKLKDGSVRELEPGKNLLDLANEISPGLARKAMAALVDGELQDLRYVPNSDVEVEILDFDSEGGRWAFRHTSAHILAQAIKRLYPDTKLAIGPAIEDGFYYDVDPVVPLIEADLVKIEDEMRKIVKENLEITRFSLPRAEALEKVRAMGEDYKVELIQDLPEDAVISFYQQGEFVDLCAGPHLMSTGSVKAIKLQSLAGAYWRGDEHNKMLTRIYGTSFPKKKDLDEHLAIIEEAKLRDHRKLGRELKLFMFSEAGPGFPFWLNNGMIVRNSIIEYYKELHKRDGYQEILTPILLNRDLWETSGHWDHYRENMYTTVIDEEDYAIKPMNCPGGMLVYKSEQRSYRDLPLRLSEMGLVHRHELSGTLHGLMRVRSFTQDDAHIYMTPDQITQEIKGVLRLVDEIYSRFNFTYEVMLSTRPEDFLGEIEDWDRAESALKQALNEVGVPFQINEGDGAFYGPKIDFYIHDSMKRTWQCGTIQLDFQLPRRFEAEYVGEDGEKHRPIMIHRAILGSLERFFAVLIEHCAGKFPVWLAPQQVRILPIAEAKHGDYAQALADEMSALGLRVDVDMRNEKLGYKIRQAQLDKVPYMVIIGDEEQAGQTVSVRRRDSEKNEQMSRDAFIDLILRQHKNRNWELE